MVNDKRNARQSILLGVAALIVCALFWSLNGPLIKLLSRPGDSLPAITIACYRSLIGGIIILPFAWRRMGTLRMVALKWRFGAVASFVLMTVCFVKATTMTAAANAIILQYTAPIWVFMLGPLLLKERFRAAEGAVLSLAMAGVAIIYLQHPASEKPALIIGLASGLGYGLVIITLRGLRHADPMAVVAMNFIGSGLVLLPAAAYWGVLQISSGRQLILVIALSVVQMALPYLLFSWALRYVKAHQASLIVLLETVFNPILTFLIVGEIAPRPTLIGGPLILAGVAAWMWLSWRGAQRET